MSDLSSVVSDDNRFSISDVGLNTNLKEKASAQENVEVQRTSHIFPTP